MNILPGGYVSAAMKCMKRRQQVTVIETELSKASMWRVDETTSNLICKTDMDRDVLSGCRLPFPSMAIEWDQKYEKGDLHSERKIMSAVDAKHIKQIFLRDISNKKEALYHLPEDKNGFYFQTLVNNNLHPHWMHWALAFYVPYSEFERIGKYLGPLGHLNFEFDLTDDRIRPVFPYLYTDFDLLKNKFEYLLHDLCQDFQQFVKFIAALSCSAVETEEVDPNKNLSRLKRSRLKYSLSKYRTIVIDAPRRRSTSETDGDGAEISPHWRRGHIRRQPTKEGIKNIWIRPTIVCRNKVVELLPLPKSKVKSQNHIRAF